MDNLLGENSFKVVDHIENHKDNLIYNQSKITDLGILFMSVEEESQQLLQILIKFEKEIEQLPRRSRKKILIEFENRTGYSIDDFQKLISKIIQIWSDTNRLIAIKKIEDVDLQLRTYAYHRDTFNHCIISFDKYYSELDFSKYMKDKVKKDKIHNITKDLHKISEHLRNHSEQIYQSLLLTD